MRILRKNPESDLFICRRHKWKQSLLIIAARNIVDIRLRDTFLSIIKNTSRWIDMTI